MKNVEAYARLLLEKGVALNPEQDLIVNAPIEAYALVEAINHLAYREFSSGTVHINWQAAKFSRHKFLYGIDKALEDVPEYNITRYKLALHRKAAVLNITSSFPKLMEGVNPERVKKATQLTSQKIRPYEQKIYTDLKWCVAAYPNEDWAEKVFPGVQIDDALENLSNAMHHGLRLDEDDPSKAWDDHLKALKRRAEKLNEMQFESLRFSSKETSFTTTLPEHHVWRHASRTTPEGETHIPNFPAEKIATAPYKFGASGTLKITRETYVRGTKIEPFTLTFKDGKVTQIKGKNPHVLQQLLGVDEGAAYMGEIALVSNQSPLASLNTKFFHTLFDENAASHIALGNAAPRSIEGGEKLNRQGLEEKGLNQSRMHFKLMIDAPDMRVEGITEKGEAVPIMEAGQFDKAFS